MKDRVILYGIGSKMLYNREWYRENYDIVGFSDSNPKKKNDIPFPEIPYILPVDLKTYEYDYIIVCSSKAVEIIDSLVKDYELSRDRIKTDHEVWFRNFFEDVHSYGEENPDKTIVIIGREGITYGLFWYVNYFSQYIREITDRGYVPVIDMQNFYNIYLEKEEMNQVNAWEFFFEQPCGISLEEAYKSRNVIHIPDTNFISDSRFAIGNIYYNKDVRRLFCDITSRYIRLNTAMQKKAEEEYKRVFDRIQEDGKKVLGVLYRGTDFKNIKPYLHAVQPDISQCIEKAKEKMQEWGMDYIYLSTDDAEAVAQMQQEFEECFLCYERIRFSNTGQTRLAFISFDRERDRYIKGVDYLMEISLLSRCDALVAGKAGGTIGALLFNQMSYEQEYFFELGNYGLENR